VQELLEVSVHLVVMVLVQIQGVLEIQVILVLVAHQVMQAQMVQAEH
jgi:hypothetical protein